MAGINHFLISGTDIFRFLVNVVITESASSTNAATIFTTSNVGFTISTLIAATVSLSDTKPTLDKAANSTTPLLPPPSLSHRPLNKVNGHHHSYNSSGESGLDIDIVLTSTSVLAVSVGFLFQL